MKIAKTNYETAKNPFRACRDAERIGHYHDVYYTRQDDKVILLGFRLHRRQYWTVDEVFAKARILAKNIKESAENLTEAEFEAACGWFTSGRICGNISEFMEVSHFRGRVQEYATELRELIKLARLIFGIETFKQGI